MTAGVTRHAAHDLQEENRARLAGLRRRTILVAIAALGMVLFGVTGVFPVGRQMLAIALGAPADVPALDVPGDFSPITFADNLASLFWFFVVVLLVGVSAGLLRRATIVLALVVTFCVGTFAVGMTSYTGSPLLILPSQLERDINAGNLGRPLEWIGSLKGNYAVKEKVMYMKAQVALRDRAQSGLPETVGKPFLDLVENVAYSLDPSEPGTGGVDFRVHYFALDFHAEVIHAIDRRLHGAPMTAVGMAYAERFGAATGPGSALGPGAVARALMLLLGLGLCRLWWNMRRRVSYIDETLHPVFSVTTVTLPQG